MEHTEPDYYRDNTPLPEGEYRLNGNYINTLYDDAIRRFNEQPNSYAEGSPSHVYTQAFWNGYGAAIAAIRDCARYFPLAPKV